MVTASLSERNSAEAPAFTTVVTAADIEKAPINSLADLLQETVGINNSTDSAGRDEIRIRGMGGRYTLMMVNGKRVSTAGAYWRGGDFNYNSIPLGAIERVEIVRGPMSALYGADAIGGVVNIITKKPTAEWKGLVSAEYRGVDSGEDGDQERISASAMGALSDAVGLSVSGEFTDRDAWFSGSASDPTEVPGLEEKKSSSVVTTTTFNINENQSLDLDITYMNDERPRSLYSYAAYSWGEDFSYREQEITRYTYGFTHNAKWDGFNTVAYIQQENSSIDDYNTSYRSAQQRTVDEKNSYAKFYATGEAGAHAWVAGVDFREQIIEDLASYLDTGKLETTTWALFAQDEISLTDKLILTLGGRLDDNDVFGDHFSPKGYLSYAATDEFVIKGGVSEAYKTPDGNQMSPEFRTTSCGGNCEIVGDPDLKPESSVNYEVGFELNKSGWDLTLVYFQNDIEDMISTAYDATIPKRYWVNVNEVQTKGVELDMSVDLTSSLELGLNATKLDIESTSTGDTDNRPEAMGNLSLNWQVADSFTTGLSAHYTGEQTYAGVDLPAYTRLDWSAAWDLTQATVVRFGVKNLTDVDLKDEDPGFLYQELGRNYYLSATYNF